MLLRPAVVVIRRVVVALVLSVFVGVTAIAQTTPAWAVDSWSTPVDLSDDTQDALVQQIVAAPNNTLTAIWYRYNGTKVVIQTRTSRMPVPPGLPSLTSQTTPSTPSTRKLWRPRTTPSPPSGIGPTGPNL